MIPMTKAHEREQYFREVVLTYDGDECLPWPYIRNVHGYGTICVDGRYKIVSRMVCEAANGPPPTPKHEAAHSCGKGHAACCAKRHLSWKTRAENMADKVEHGTHHRGERNPSAKLKKSDVEKIIWLVDGGMTQQAVADQYSISQSTVSLIVRGRLWAKAA